MRRWNTQLHCRCHLYTGEITEACRAITLNYNFRALKQQATFVNVPVVESGTGSRLHLVVMAALTHVNSLHWTAQMIILLLNSTQE